MTAAAGSHPTARRLLPPIAIGLLAAIAFVGLYTSALHAPRPHDLPVALVAPAGAQAELQRRLDAAAPGAFALDAYPSEAAARAAVLDRDADGAFLAGPQPRLLVAEAGGPATAEALRGAFGAAAAAAGARLAVEDLRPLPEGDARGLSEFFTVVGATVASIVFAAVLLGTGRDLPPRARLAAATVFAAAVGLAIALTVGPLVGTLEGSFWGVAGIAALLSLAVSLPTAALGRLLGPPGIGLSALVLMLFAMSASGGPVGHRFLPGFYDAFSQALPGGAALTAIRNTVWFDGAATLAAIAVLAAWALAGLALELAGARRRPPTTAAAARGAAVASGAGAA